MGMQILGNSSKTKVVLIFCLLQVTSPDRNAILGNVPFISTTSVFNELINILYMLSPKIHTWAEPEVNWTHALLPKYFIILYSGPSLPTRPVIRIILRL